MDAIERLRIAAESGNIDALGTILNDDPNVLEHIDGMGTIDTPLHIAAVRGNPGFAMEIMNLKPSFGRKLNQDRLAPIHLAYLNQHTEMVIDFLLVDKDLGRVKGTKGFTVLHHVARDGNVRLLYQILDLCPECILDLTFRRQTALHIAAESSQLEAFTAMVVRIHWAEKRKFFNLQDEDGNTILHLAASNNQPQMIKVLVGCHVVDKYKTNNGGYTATDVLERQIQGDTRESINILNNYSRPNSAMSELFVEMKLEIVAVFLVVVTMILAMSYQAILSPPGGFYEADANATSNRQGRSAMNSSVFLIFYIPNGTVFLISFFAALKSCQLVARKFYFLLLPFYIMMLLCYGMALLTIAPSYGLAVFVYASSMASSLVIILLYERSGSWSGRISWFCYLFFPFLLCGVAIALG